MGAKEEIYFAKKGEKNFPKELLQTPWPPKGIYIKGNIQNDAPLVAIVGTRRATSYGKDIAFKIAETLAREGVIIVSGLALGIDSAAHEGALKAGGKTWAVLGSGVENIWPRSNIKLAGRILESGGALISEYPPGTKAQFFTFPQRNRIVAGLSKLVIVVEAPEKSGALITARLALEAGREVAAVPGDITRANFLGANRLLREGAHQIVEPKDALYLIGKEPKEKILQLDSADKIGESILQCLNEPKSADKIILATDEDREGEAIAWHLIAALGLENRPGNKIERIVFHEITEKAIKEALKNPRELDLKLINAQQARRILDRIVGYKLSPFLWKKVYRGLSAGRVQSVAVRLIAEREREIQNFKPEEYWTISANLKKTDTKEELEANLAKKDGGAINKFDIKTKEEADGILKELEKKEWRVLGVEKKAVSKNPWPPFTTSTLQQEAFRRLGFSAKQTMRLAQQLYEGVELGEGAAGLITYMRTDSLNLSEDSLASAKEYLAREVGEKYALPSPRRFKTKSKGAQEAHEAIRPSDPARVPESVKPFLDQRQYRLYDLIWRRFTASQMPQALFDATSVDIKAGLPAQAGDYTFRANGQTLKFDGFLKIYPLKFTELSLPELKLEEELELVKLRPAQHFTEPPPRFSEASLIKILEKNGIGRPSTYAPTISTIQERGYVKKNEKRQLEPS